MKIINNTGMPHLLYEKLAPHGGYYNVLVVRGTFDLNRSTGIMTQAKKQTHINYGDKFSGPINTQPWRAVLQEEGDLLIGKPSTDIQVYGHLRTLNNEPMTSWKSTVQVGNVEHSLQLTGPRNYFKTDNGWELTEPEPINELLLDYRSTYGGCFTDYRTFAKDNDAFIAYSDNQSGCGWLPTEQDLEALKPELRKNIEEQLGRLTELEAPQILGINDNLTSPYESLTPQGFGPVARWNKPRQALAGTFDQHWKEQRMPLLPEDFNAKFYQAAHPSLITESYLVGDESISLAGCFADGTLTSNLPSVRPVILQKANSNSDFYDMYLDTVRFYLDKEKLVLLWRFQMPLDADVDSWDIVLEKFDRKADAEYEKQLLAEQAKQEQRAKEYNAAIEPLTAKKNELNTKIYTFEKMASTRPLTTQELAYQQDILESLAEVNQQLEAIAGRYYG